MIIFCAYAFHGYTAIISCDGSIAYTWRSFAPLADSEAPQDVLVIGSKPLTLLINPRDLRLQGVFTYTQLPVFSTLFMTLHILYIYIYCKYNLNEGANMASMVVRLLSCRVHGCGKLIVRCGHAQGLRHV